MTTHDTEYLTAQEAADAWGLSLRRVQDLCKARRIYGAYRSGEDGYWRIPPGASKPANLPFGPKPKKKTP